MPHLVRRFVRRLPPVDGIPAAVIAVYGDDFAGPPSARRRVSGFEGGALDDAARLLSRRGYAVRTTRGVGFPGSFTQFVAATRRGGVPAHARRFRGRGRGHRGRPRRGTPRAAERAGRRPGSGPRVVGAMFSLVGRRALGKMYVADERCTSCGWCERACPSRTIRHARLERRPGGCPAGDGDAKRASAASTAAPRSAIQVSGLRIAALTRRGHAVGPPGSPGRSRGSPSPARGSSPGSSAPSSSRSSVDLLLRLLERVPGVAAPGAAWGHTRPNGFRLRYRGPAAMPTRVMKRGALPILFVYVVIELLGMSLILPLLPYYAQSFSASALLVGLLGTSNALAQVHRRAAHRTALRPVRPAAADPRRHPGHGRGLRRCSDSPGRSG